MRVISKLMLSMEKDTRIKVEAQPGYQQAYRESNLLELWHMVEQVVQGRGAMSIFALTTKFLKMRQEGPEDWPRYAKEWKNTTNELMKFGTPDKVLEAMFNTHLVMSINQEQFKEKLTPIYGTNV